MCRQQKTLYWNFVHIKLFIIFSFGTFVADITDRWLLKDRANECNMLCQHVGYNMLRSFVHHVGLCCVQFETSDR